MSKDKRPVLIAMPSIGWLKGEVIPYIIGAYIGGGPGTGFHMEHGARSIAAKRNSGVRRLLAAPEFRGIVFLDDDMAPPADLIPRLLAHGKDIVGGVAFQRVPPFNMGVRPLGGDGTTIALPDHGQQVPPLEVRDIGMAATFVHRRVFEAMPAPWFHHPPDTPGGGEDYWFCDRAREAGFKVYVDLNLDVGHGGWFFMNKAANAAMKRSGITLTAY